MNAMTPLHLYARARQAGMTLIELLISITIGLFIIGAALMVFQSTSGVGSQISELTQLRQQGMHAFRVIGRQVREAGAVEPEYIDYNNNFRFTGIDTDGDGIGDGVYEWAGGTSISAFTAPTGATAGTNTLGISQQLQTSDVYKKLIRNCLGAEIKSGQTTSNFYLKPVSSQGYSDLMCATGANPNGQPVISNVAAFKVRYRVRPSAANLTTKQFVETPSNWALVDAVEVCLDLVGNRSMPNVETNYTNCDGQSVEHGNRLHVVQRNLFTVFSAQR